MAIIYAAIVIGLIALLLTMPWHHPDARAGAPAWWVWWIALPTDLALGWFATFQVAGIRAMYQHRDAPVPDD